MVPKRTWQSPSNAHAYRLYVVNEPALALRLALNSTAISRALDYDTLLKDLSTLRVFQSQSTSFGSSPSCRELLASVCLGRSLPTQLSAEFLIVALFFWSLKNGVYTSSCAAPKKIIDRLSS
jgi:hypothetical protein